jgi:alcohol dehydrogenase
MRPYQYQPAGQIVFGPGASQKIDGLRPLRHVSRILLVSDAGVEDAGLVEPIRKSLENRIVLSDREVRPDGDVSHIDALAAKAVSLDVQAIVAVGGGSVMDSSKAVAAVMKKGGSIADYEGFATIRSTLIPVVCVPTTTGTGAESTQFVVVNDAATGAKRIISDLSLVPRIGVLDPDLVMHLPAAIAAATAADALTHAVEALGSKMANPLGDALALEALRIMLGSAGFERSLVDGDSESKANMMTAANLAGQAISSSMLGACHAFAHAFGAVKKIPHGLANGLFLGSVMRFNLPRAQSKYARIGTFLGQTGDEAQKAIAAIEEIERLLHQTAGIPRDLKAVELTEEDIPILVAQVMADPDLATNPVALRDPEVVEKWIREKRGQ